jgi:hypothetical protein
MGPAALTGLLAGSWSAVLVGHLMANAVVLDNVKKTLKPKSRRHGFDCPQSCGCCDTVVIPSKYSGPSFNI